MSRITKAVLAIAGVGVLAAVAVPYMTSPVCVGTEVSAAATLLNMASAEATVQRAARIDVDQDGVGEFGFLAELSGAAGLPGQDAVLDPPSLGGVFRTVAADGSVTRGCYRFRVFLPDAQGHGVRELGTPPAPGGPHRSRAPDTDRVDPGLASRRWCAYAWPSVYGRSGSRTFFIDQDQNRFAVNDPRYSGDHGPEPGAAFADGGLASILGAVKPGVVAQDGNVWRNDGL